MRRFVLPYIVVVGEYALFFLFLVFAGELSVFATFVIGIPVKYLFCISFFKLSLSEEDTNGVSIPGKTYLTAFLLVMLASFAYALILLLVNLSLYEINIPIALYYIYIIGLDLISILIYCRIFFYVCSKKLMELIDMKESGGCQELTVISDYRVLSEEKLGMRKFFIPSIVVLVEYSLLSTIIIFLNGAEFFYDLFYDVEVEEVLAGLNLLGNIFICWSFYKLVTFNSIKSKKDLILHKHRIATMLVLGVRFIQCFAVNTIYSLWDIGWSHYYRDFLLQLWTCFGLGFLSHVITSVNYSYVNYSVANGFFLIFMDVVFLALQCSVYYVSMTTDSGILLSRVQNLTKEN